MIILGGGPRETDCPARAALERAMRGARISNEICSGPGITRKEILREQITLQQIARPACRDKVARCVRAAVGARMNVIEGGSSDVERRRAIHTATSAIAHGRALDRMLEGADRHSAIAAGEPACDAG